MSFAIVTDSPPLSFALLFLFPLLVLPSSLLSYWFARSPLFSLVLFVHLSSLVLFFYFLTTSFLFSSINLFFRLSSLLLFYLSASLLFSFFHTLFCPLGQCDNLLEQLPSLSSLKGQSFSVTPFSFEKDDDSHMRVVASVGNLRARFVHKSICVSSYSCICLSVCPSVR